MRPLKDSKLDTIGKVPTSWRQRRLKYLCRVQTGNEDTQNANPDGQYPFFVRSPILERCDRYTFDGEGILVAGDGAGAGRVFHHAFGKYAVHQRVYRLSKFQFSSRFLFYWLSLLFPYEMDKGSAQSTVPSMRLPMLLNFTVFMPSMEEALSISSYLDIKCGEIDGLAEDIRAEIATLEEYKKSLITEAVTKGIRGNRPMKDSGVEWIGKIPEEWNVNKTAWLWQAQKGINASELTVEYCGTHIGEYPVYSGQTENNGIMGLIDTYAYDVKDTGCLFATTVGAKAMSVSYLKGRFSLSQNCMIMQPLKKEIVVRYFYYAYSHIFSYYRGMIPDYMQPSFRVKDFYAYPVFVPPVSEQTEIAGYLDERSSEIDACIELKREQLATLEEYKKSLIYEYVTGKKEVPTP